MAITNCKNPTKKSALKRIKNNLPDYPVMAMMEAESVSGKGAVLSEDFIRMLRDAFDIKPFMDVKYRGAK